MDTKALKQKILDLAIRGKLVPQDPNDEPASVLLEKIQAEKMQMVNDGKLKSKDLKNDTVIFIGEDNLHYEKFSDGTVKCIEEEISFKIPKSWIYVRIRDIASVKGGKRIPKGKEFSAVPTSHAYIRVTNMKNRTITTSDLKYISDEIYKTIQNYTISKKDLYLTIAGTIGLVGEVPDLLDGMNLTENAVKVTPFIINKTFLCFCLLSSFVQNQFKYKTHQVAQPKLAIERILNTVIPIPPLNEQILITDSLRTAFNLVHCIENQKTTIVEAISKTKSKILDLAIRGKLVPQNPDDEPASVLLERIRREKAQLIKSGKIKKDKRESVIFLGEDNLHYEKFNDGTILCIEDEIPYKEPPGWIWSRIGSVFNTITGNTPSTKDSSLYGNEFPFYKPTDLDAGFSVTKSLTSVSKKGFETSRQVPMLSVLVTCIGTIGKTGLIRKPGICNQQINAILPNEFSNSEYIYYSMCSNFQQQQMITNSSATTIPILNKGKFDSLLYLVPPLNEQVRIARQINNIFEIIESVEKQQN